MSKTTIPAGGITDGTLTSAKLDQDGAFTFNEDSADVDFRVEGNGDTHAIFMNGELDHVNFGSSDASLYQVDIKDATAFDPTSNTANSAPLRVRSSATSGAMGAIALGGSNNNGIFNSGSSEIGIQGYNSIKFFCSTTNDDKFGTKTERVRIRSDGNFCVGSSNTDPSGNNVTGATLQPNGRASFSRDSDHALDINRQSDDGAVAAFRQAGSTEGSISISGSTTSYVSFSGSHWSRLADNSKPTILRGTVMESISTMMDWYGVNYTVNGKPRYYYLGALPDGKSVGDNHTFTVDGDEHTGTISKEANEQLPKCKISDTEDSKAVYGVFMDWDNDEDTLNDMYVTALGAFVVRIHGDETVAIGDYLQSKGDGTAKKQADDILRASTIAKVTSTEKTHTYDDGSYCVPCTLHCG